MVKNSFKNYFKSLKYFFVPIGIFFSAIAIGLSIILPLSAHVFDGFINRVIEISGNVNFNLKSFSSSIYDEIRTKQITINTLKSGISITWVYNVLIAALKASLGDSYIQASNELSALLDSCVDDLKKYLVLFAIICGIGLVISIYLTRKFIRKELAPRPFWRGMLIRIAHFILSLTIIALCIRIITWLKYSAIVVAILTLTLLIFISMVEAFFAYGYKRVKFKQIVSFKNLVKLLLCNMLLFLTSLACCYIAFLFNSVAGLIAGYGFIIVTFSVLGANIDGCIRKEVENLILHKTY